MAVELSNRRQSGSDTLRFAQFAFLFSSLLLIGCGPQFQAIQTGENSYLSQQATDSSVSKAEQELNQQLQWESIPESEWANPAFIPSDSNAGTSGTDQVFTFTLTLPYGKIFDLASGAIKLSRPLACQDAQIDKSLPESYRNGEIPCGKILDDNWKRIALFNVPTVSQVKDSSTFTLQGFELPVKISRRQRTGSYVENSLDERKEVSKTSHSKFANDISVQYIPRGQNAILKICGTMPGMTVAVPDRILYGNMKKRVLGINVSASGSGHVSFGNYTYDFARACSEVLLAYDLSTQKPKVEIKNLHSAQVANGQYSGFRIEFREWWLKLIDGLMGLFGRSIENSIEKAVDSEVNDFTNNEVENGAWMERMVRDSLRNKLDKSINQTLTNEFSATAVPTGTSEFKAKLLRECRKVNLMQNLSESLQSFTQDCESFVRDIDVVVNPFYRDPELEAKGCYSHLGNIFETKDNSVQKWWAQECAFKVQAQVRVPQHQIEKLLSFKELLAFNSSVNKLQDDLQALANGSQLSPNELLALADQILREKPELADPVALKAEIKLRLGL